MITLYKNWALKGGKVICRLPLQGTILQTTGLKGWGERKRERENVCPRGGGRGDIDGGNVLW